MLYHDSPILGLDFPNSGFLIFDRQLENTEYSVLSLRNFVLKCVWKQRETEQNQRNRERERDSVCVVWELCVSGEKEKGICFLRVDAVRDGMGSLVVVENCRRKRERDRERKTERESFLSLQSLHPNLAPNPNLKQIDALGARNPPPSFLFISYHFHALFGLIIFFYSPRFSSVIY